jgi:hypothetical protein
MGDKMKKQAVTGGLDTIVNIFWRILAVFAASGLTVLGAGAVVGVELWDAVFMAGILGVATVIEKLARSFLEDGKLTLSEIDEAFAKVDKNSK